MPGCAAINCSNSATKGFLMKHFPKDKVRRKLWLIKMKRDDWSPTNYSCLCEVHFGEEMWEKQREDGSRRLKNDAVPNIFTFTKQKTKRKPPAQRQVKSVLNNQISESEEKLQNPNQPIQDVSLVNNLESNQMQMKYESMQKKLLEYEKQYKKTVTKANRFEKELKYIKNKLKISNETKNSQMLNSVFNIDQINALNRNSTKFMKWSNSTVMKALKLKFSCGNNGYEELLKQNIPLPSLRTLRRRLQNLKFGTGILHEVFKFLQIKIETFKDEHEKECVLIMDEMSITPANLFDVSTNQNIGKVTLPKHEGTATNVLVFMLGGITTRWKQTVAYYFTGKSIDGTVYHDIVANIISISESIGLKIIGIVSDMGSSNQKLWKKLNITAGRHGEISNCFPHPLDYNRKIYIIPDVPHLFKNIKNMLMINKILYISDKIKNLYNLPTNMICSSHIEDIIKFQEKLDFLLVPKLSEQNHIIKRFILFRLKIAGRKNTKLLNKYGSKSIACHA